MRRILNKLLLPIAIVTFLLMIFVFAWPSMQQAFFYPKPQKLPPIVGESTQQLLTKLQSILETNAPQVMKSLQSGLSESQISALEAKGAFRLSEDMKALYRWRNGVSSNNTNNLLPGLRFLPLEEAIDERINASQQLNSASFAQQMAFSVFAGHRKNWICVFDDGAGDGFFYDFERVDAEGAFFYHLSEVGYQWFPSLRNFLSGIIECYENQANKTASDGKDSEINLELMWSVFERLSESNESEVY